MNSLLVNNIRTPKTGEIVISISFAHHG